MTAQCDHWGVNVRSFKCANGTIQFVYQCAECGEKVGNPIKKQAAIVAVGGNPDLILPFDEHARDCARESRAEARQAARANELAEFRVWYGEYQKSAEWAAMRAKVMQRAKGLCEGCLSRPAVDVHHLTYDNVGQEFAYQLVALCRPCHERAHESRADSE